LEKNREVWLDEAQELARVGYWELNLVEKTVFWSDVTRQIHEKEHDYIPNLEEGINFYDKKSKPIITKAVNDAVNLGKPFNEQLKIITAKGNIRWVHTIGRPHFEGKNITKILGVFQDITATKLKEEKLLKKDLKINKLNQSLTKKVDELRRLNSELEEFTYLTTHDLKTPIANIEGFIGILKKPDASLSDENSKKAIFYIEESIQEAYKKIGKLVALAGIKKLAKEQKQSFNLNLLIQDILDELKVELEDKGINVAYSLKENNMIRFNPDALRLVLFNLITNAIKYRCNLNPTIAISIRETKKYIQILVKDNGIGIDLDRNGEKIFGMFNRFNTLVKGDGMGLYYSKKIIENNEGAIKLKSALGKGSTFTVEIPLMN